MNTFLEFIGYPGSGKTFYSQKLKEYLKKKKLRLIKADNYFFDYYSSGIINKLIYKNYYQYKKNKKFESKILFKKQYKYLNNQLDKSIKKNQLKLPIKNFGDLLDLTDLNKESKKSALNNFKIDLCTFFLKQRKKKYLIYNDEGLVQKVYQSYKNDIKINKLNKEINKYLSSIPIANINIIINTNFDKSIKNSEKREKGFKYNIKGIDETKKKFQLINLIIKKNLRNRTKIFIIKNKISLDKQIKGLINYL